MLKRLLLFAFVLLSHFSFSQNVSNKGTDFWISYGNHVEMFDTMDTLTPGRTELMRLYMTSDVGTSGFVEIAGINFKVPFTVVANTISFVDIPRAAALMDEGEYNLGIHVTSKDPIVVYSYIYFNAVSGATLCLPVNTLGKEYYSVNYTQISNLDNSYSFFDVIATDTGITAVEIIPSQDTKGGRPAGVPYVVYLSQGEVYQALGARMETLFSPYDTVYRGVDLTGTQIRSISTATNKCKKIAVFCGSGKISIGCKGTGSSDNLYQQMNPVSTWGKTYLTVPGVDQSNDESHQNFYRIFKSTPSAIVRLNGVVLPANEFVGGQYYDFSNGIPNNIESDKAILVAQYFPTSDCRGGRNTDNGDPEMIYLNPLEQTISSVTLNSLLPMNSNINDHFINVVVRNIPEVINSFKIDGKQAGNFIVHPNNKKYAYAQISVKYYGHTLTCDSGFNAIAYGYGNVESYGYSAGTNLRDLYQYVTIQNEYATEQFASGCKNSPFRLSINLPYKADKIQWLFKGLFRDTVIFSPVADSTWKVDDRILYRYQLKTPYTVGVSGTYPITVVANNPVADGCSGEQIIDHSLQIFDRHKSGFTSTGSGCLNSALNFTDTSNAGNGGIIRRFWDFGDGSHSGMAAPEHRYNKKGSYTVKLSTISRTGCLSDTSSAIVVLAESPNAAFIRKDSACEYAVLHFVAEGGSATKWTWDFGDGTGSSGQSPVHTFRSAGTYNVKLNVENDLGCGDSTLVPVEVNHLPVADFELPQSCTIDAAVNFLDASRIADQSEDGFSYWWSFGDARATNQNPDTSISKNPSHKYPGPATYQVTLKVTSKNGCSADTIQQYSHYPAFPNAAFDLMYPTSVCGDTDITIINRSAIASGKISKVEIYWDLNHDTLAKTVDLTPAPGKDYSYKYPVSNGASARTFVVMLKAYSGPDCMHSTTKTITVSPALQLQFDPLASVCEQEAPFIINGAREMNGSVGSGFFSGPGITPEGLFDPRVAKAGLHTLRYTFAVSDGCSSSVEQTIQVLAAPFADAGPDVMVIEGGSVVIQAKGSENGTYTWTPATALDNNGTLTPTVSPAEDMTYRLQIISPEGCTSTDSVVVRIKKDITVPNAFSPNGDGINDTWKIPSLDLYADASIKVFNRYGQPVFYSKGYSKEWNGQHQGTTLPMGTYYYIINFKDGKRPVSGSVTIIR